MDVQYQGGMQQQTMVVDIVPTPKLHFNLVCRVCGNENERNINIFGTEGQNYELALKMNSYLPVKVADNDKLPLNCCWKCLSAILSWHELVITSIETDKKLKELQANIARTVVMSTQKPEIEPEAVLPHDEHEEITPVSLSAFCDPIAVPDTNSAGTTLEFLSQEDDKEVCKIIEHPPENNMETMQKLENILSSKTANKKSGFKLKILKMNKKENVVTTSGNSRITKYDFNCEFCGVKFAKNEHVVQHVKEKHQHKINLLKEMNISQNLEMNKKFTQMENVDNIDLDAWEVLPHKIDIEEIKITGYPQEKNTEDIKIQDFSLLKSYNKKTAFKLKVLKMDKAESVTCKNSGNNEMLKNDLVCAYCDVKFVKNKDMVRHVQEQHPHKVDLTEIMNISENLEKENQTKIEQSLNFDTPDTLTHTIDVEEIKIEEENEISHLNKTDLPETINTCQNPVTKKKRLGPKINQEAINGAKITINNKVYYRCKICGKLLCNPYTYSRHIQIHTNERPYVCNLCGKQFCVSQGLARHFRETHQGIKKFCCDICGRMFTSLRNVEEHRRIHTHERPYVCEWCGKAFWQQASLTFHNRSHTDKFLHHCSDCNLTFRTKGALLIHTSRHTGEKP